MGFHLGLPQSHSFLISKMSVTPALLAFSCRVVISIKEHMEGFYKLKYRYVEWWLLVPLEF